MQWLLPLVDTSSSRRFIECKQALIAAPKVLIDKKCDCVFVASIYFVKQNIPFVLYASESSFQLLLRCNLYNYAPISEFPIYCSFYLSWKLRIFNKNDYRKSVKKASKVICIYPQTKQKPSSKCYYLSLNRIVCWIFTHWMDWIEPLNAQEHFIQIFRSNIFVIPTEIIIFATSLWDVNYDNGNMRNS